MNVKNILCPIDFSVHSEQALAYASTLARESQAKLHLVYVYEPPLVYAEPHDGFVPPADMSPQMEIFEAVRPPRSVLAIPAGIHGRFGRRGTAGIPRRRMPSI